MIREATIDDIPDLIVLFEHLHAASGTGPFDKYKAGETALRLIDDEDGIVLRSERGVLMGRAGMAWYSTQWLVAEEACCWAEDGKWLALLKAFKAWAQEIGADEVRINSTLSPKSGRIARAFKRRIGVSPLQVCYREVI